jgi:Leucine-rich repeat (LRR) protein
VVDGNQLVQFEKLPPNLTKLSLSNNRLQEISIHLTTLRQLKELDLSDNKISNIPDHIKDLSELEDLKLDRNLLEELPQVLAKCGKLKTLSTRFNRLKGDKEKIKKRIYQCISSEILESSSVQILNLDGNPMTKFDLEAMQGVEVFLQRRQLLKDKEIHGGLSTDTSLCGLD